MFIGAGTVANIVAVIVGGSAGIMIGHVLAEHTRKIITDALGLVTLIIAGQAVIAVFDPALASRVGSSAPLLIVLGALVLGGIAGSLLRIEFRLEAVGSWLQARLGSNPRSATDGIEADQNDLNAIPEMGSERGGDAVTGEAKERFIEGFVTASLVFCVGPLTILGSLQDGLGLGADQLFLKSALDGFAALAFAASFGLGVVASAISVAVVQGSLTLVGVLLGSFLPDAYLLAITATGGLILIGVALRLLNIRKIAVGDLLPGLIVAPLLVGAVGLGIQSFG